MPKNMFVNQSHFWLKVVTSRNVSLKNSLRDAFAYLSDTCTAADISCWDSAWTNILATNSTTCSVWNMKSPFRWFLSCLSCGTIKDKFTYLVIDHEFRHHIVKVVVDPRGGSRVDPQTTLTMLWRNSWSITGQTHQKLTSICFLR